MAKPSLLLVAFSLPEVGEPVMKGGNDETVSMAVTSGLDARGVSTRIVTNVDGDAIDVFSSLISTVSSVDPEVNGCVSRILESTTTHGLQSRSDCHQSDSYYCVVSLSEHHCDVPCDQSCRSVLREQDRPQSFGVNCRKAFGGPDVGQAATGTDVETSKT